MSLALDKKIQDGDLGREKREREKLINGSTNQISWGKGNCLRVTPLIRYMIVMNISTLALLSRPS